MRPPARADVRRSWPARVSARRSAYIRAAARLERRTPKRVARRRSAAFPAERSITEGLAQGAQQGIYHAALLSVGHPRVQRQEHGLCRCALRYRQMQLWRQSTVVRLEMD